MDASIQSQGERSEGFEASQYKEAKSSTGELSTLPSMALDSSIHAGMTALRFV
jgi:hypothetical protein